MYGFLTDIKVLIQLFIENVYDELVPFNHIPVWV